jgi:hypothetical protein
MLCTSVVVKNVLMIRRIFLRGLQMDNTLNNSYEYLRGIIKRNLDQVNKIDQDNEFNPDQDIKDLDIVVRPAILNHPFF